jgi:hypothetical protein
MLSRQGNLSGLSDPQLSLTVCGKKCGLKGCFLSEANRSHYFRLCVPRRDLCGECERAAVFATRARQPASSGDLKPRNRTSTSY